MIKIKSFRDNNEEEEDEEYSNDFSNILPEEEESIEDTPKSTYIRQNQSIENMILALI